MNSPNVFSSNAEIISWVQRSIKYASQTSVKFGADKNNLETGAELGNE